MLQHIAGFWAVCVWELCVCFFSYCYFHVGHTVIFVLDKGFFLKHLEKKYDYATHKGCDKPFLFLNLDTPFQRCEKPNLGVQVLQTRLILTLPAY